MCPVGQRPLEDGAREPVDLNDQQAPPTGHGRGAQPETPDDAVDRRLGAEKQIVESHPRRPDASIMGHSGPVSTATDGRALRPLPAERRHGPIEECVAKRLARRASFGTGGDESRFRPLATAAGASMPS